MNLALNEIQIVFENNGLVIIDNWQLVSELY
jgi:hypothetical protein